MSTAGLRLRISRIPYGIFQADMGKTPLMKAAQDGHTECVRLLLENGAYKNATMSVRFEIAQNGCFRLIAYLFVE